MNLKLLRNLGIASAVVIAVIFGMGHIDQMQKQADIQVIGNPQQNTSYLEEEFQKEAKEKQEWMEMLSAGHKHCQTLTENSKEWDSCHLEYFRDAIEFCEKYPDENPQGCVELRIDIAKDPQLSHLLS